jgi:RNA polymerase sigma-70 factor (ECF subfamily)
MAPRFESLIDRHHDEIFSYLWRLLGPERRSDVTLEVEDLAQEVFLRAYEAFRSLRPNSNYRAWLYRIATNCAFTKLRRVKNRREKIALWKASPATEDSSAKTDHERLRTAVNRLSPKQKACVTLRFYDDRDYAEIAAIVGCSEMSARANVSQAIRRLRDAIKE